MDVEPGPATLSGRQKRWLDKGKIAKLVESLRRIKTTHAELAKKIRNEGR
jgi:hypothetical protein